MPNRRIQRYVLAALICATPYPQHTMSAQTIVSCNPCNVYQTTLLEPNQKTPEISTSELLAILATGSEPVFDVRTAKEYAIAHIPGSINVFEKEVDRITQLYPDRSSRMILYCNGPSCGKSKRTSEQLVALGYTNVRRYQLGMPVWRALSQTVQTDMLGLSYIYSGDKTAVFVDARTPAEFASATVPGAVNIQAGEATAANDDGRLPLQDKGTRVVVFGNTPEQSRIVAAEIAKKAYWNSSYFGGTLADLVQAGYVNHAPVAIARNVAVAAGPACTAAITPGAIDAGSFDPDVDDSVSLSIDPAGPLGLGDHVISLIATDSHGASSVSPATVTVADRSAPVVSDLSVDQPVLWPPDHRMETVTLRYVTSDNCGAVSTEIAVSSTDAGKPDAQSGESSDWRILDANHVSLRAERAGGGDRIYWISVIATDAAGNRSAGSLTVRVPASAR